MRTLVVPLLAIAACNAPASPPAADDVALAAAPLDDGRRAGGTLSVLTQNLYIGIDLTPLLQATTPAELADEVAAAFDMLGPGGTDLPARAGAIAHEIARRGPDLVGVEEAALWTRGAPVTVRYDFLALLVDALCGVEHVCYTPVVVQVNSDFTVAGNFGGTLEPVRLVDRDAILLRDGSRVRVQRSEEGHFAAALSIPTPLGVTFTLPRGWVAVDAALDGRPFRLVDTHLEAFSPAVRDRQAVELLLGPTLVPRPVVAAGDFNFDDATPAYRLTRLFGFADAWHETRPRQPGFTCCQDPDLRNLPSKLDDRIDFVFARGLEPERTERIGASPAERVDGLWPSDHAGVAAALRPLRLH